MKPEPRKGDERHLAEDASRIVKSLKGFVHVAA